MGTSVLRVFSGVLASAAVSGAFVVAVAIVRPGAGPAPHWPADQPVRVVPMPLPREEPSPAVRALTFTPVVTPAGAAVRRVVVPVRPRAAATPKAAAPVTPATTAPVTPGPAAPPTSPPAAAAPPESPTPTPTPSPTTTRPLQPVRDVAGQTVSTATRTVATTVAPVSPPVADTVQQTGDTVAALVTGP